MERLLLIDDDDTTREVLTLLLTGQGWTVTEACGGEEAVAMAASFAPEVILSDLQMPGLSGPDLAAALRSACHEKPVLLAMTATRKGDPPAGFDALLVKPFDPAEVRRVCDSLSSGLSSPMENAANAGPSLAVETFGRMRKSMPLAQLRALYDFALKDAEGRVAKMETFAADLDDAGFRREAHALKGSCGMIGAERLRTLAADAEEKGITTSMPSNRFQEFRSEIEQVRRMLDELLSEYA